MAGERDIACNRKVIERDHRAQTHHDNNKRAAQHPPQQAVGGGGDELLKFMMMPLAPVGEAREKADAGGDRQHYQGTMFDLIGDLLERVDADAGGLVGDGGRGI